VNEKPLSTETKNKRSISGYGFGVSPGAEGKFIVRGSVSWRAEDELPQADPASRDPRAWF
jgi:hypothetical protein